MIAEGHWLDYYVVNKTMIKFVKPYHHLFLLLPNNNLKEYNLNLFYTLDFSHI